MGAIMAITAIGAIPALAATTPKVGTPCSTRDLGKTVSAAGRVPVACIKSGKTATWQRAAASATTTAPEATNKPMSTTFDPYAGTRPGTTPIGRRTEGRITTPDGRSRHYRLYVPDALPTTGAAPLLIALHGGLGTAAQFEANSGFDDLAEANTFIVAYPDGIGNQPDGSGLQTWNGGYCCGPAATRNVDDVGFVRQLIDTLVARWPVDPTRIYAAGHSNGGILAYRLACELSDKIVAIGVQAGSNVVDGCSPSSPVSVLHIHGTADTNMPITGGRGSGLSATIFRSARSAVDALAAANGCTLAPSVASDPSNADVSALTWSSCTSAVAVRYIVVNGATHAWMGHPAQSAGASTFVGDPYPHLDASRAIWSFLAAHPRRPGP